MARFLHFRRYFLSLRHCGERQMFNFMTKELCLPRMASYFFVTIRGYRSCAQNHLRRKRQRQINLFFPKGSLQYIGIDI